MNDSLLQLEVENLRELLRLKNLNKQLLDANYNLLSRITQYHEEKGIPLDIGIQTLLGEVKHVLNEINPTNRDLTGRNTNREDNRAGSTSRK